MSEYRKHLIDTITNLEAVRIELFDNLINIGMTGVHSDIDEVFEPGDEYVFELEHFENTSDPNLDAMVRLIRHIDVTARRIVRTNSVKNGEINF